MECGVHTGRAFQGPGRKQGHAGCLRHQEAGGGGPGAAEEGPCRGPRGPEAAWAGRLQAGRQGRQGRGSRRRPGALGLTRWDTCLLAHGVMEHSWGRPGAKVRVLGGAGGETGRGRSSPSHLCGTAPLRTAPLRTAPLRASVVATATPEGGPDSWCPRGWAGLGGQQLTFRPGSSPPLGRRAHLCPCPSLQQPGATQGHEDRAGGTRRGSPNGPPSPGLGSPRMLGFVKRGAWLLAVWFLGLGAIGT